jgi:hypothetical protein
MINKSMLKPDAEIKMQHICSALFSWQGSFFCLQFILAPIGPCLDAVSRGSEGPPSFLLPAFYPADFSAYSLLRILYEGMDWIQMTGSSGELFWIRLWLLRFCKKREKVVTTGITINFPVIPSNMVSIYSNNHLKYNKMKEDCKY